MSKAAVPPRTAPERAARAHCPVMEPAVAGQYRIAVKASSEFSLGCLAWLKGMPPRAQAAWMKTSVESGRVLFQPWTMEILYAIAVQGRARFTELQDLLGVSSRTLSDKLKLLRDEGFVERAVFDEQPVRIEYSLTKRGRVTAALATPLFAQLNDADARQAAAAKSV